MVYLSNGSTGPFVKIAAVMGVIAVALTALFGYFMSESAWIVAPVVGIIAVMGILLGYFASKRY